MLQVRDQILNIALSPTKTTPIQKQGSENMRPYSLDWAKIHGALLPGGNLRLRCSRSENCYAS